MQFDLFLFSALSMPFLIILVTMIGLKWNALKAGWVAFLITLAGAPVVLGVNLHQLTTDIVPGSVLEAANTSLSILWIIFGALCIYYLQLNSGAIASIQQQLARLHPNPKISALFVAWFFSMFMEGAAGFGTSAALTAPFLVAAGYRPVLAVVLALWGHSLGVTFGAVGTPVITQALLVAESELALARAALPYMFPTTLVLAIGLAWGCIRYAPASAESVSSIGDKPQKFSLAAIKFGVLAALSFLFPATLLAYFLGPELPTLLGAIVGAALFTLFTRFEKPSLGQLNEVASTKLPSTSFIRAMAPYLILVILVLITRLIPDIKAGLQAVVWHWEWRNYHGTVQYLYHPGSLLFVSFVFGGLCQRHSISTKNGTLVRALGRAFAQALSRVLTVLSALFVMLLLSRVLVHTGAITQLGQTVAAFAGAWWPFWVPWFGILGTFITGSATSSNILFSEFQRSAALASGNSVIPLLGAQTFGAAAGNMVCPHNIIAAGATVNLAGDEGQVMRFTLPMAALLATLAGTIAVLMNI
ncbi:L-lactate permease [Aliidiomarina shirensis]|uniref:L-lactate permease n=1 Tax=Aliidiomarina shirensis TaxID=1048642 RepID=A0A432WT33_9GAMM|nr:L-lactate permease [Aliidiomarina shirensis]RUO36898.1 L-lactate permease [Aliidiomarina shirensis]